MRPAVSGSWAVARIALPCFVLATNQDMPIKSGTVTTATKTCRNESSTVLTPMYDRRFTDGRTLSMLLLAGPAMSRAMFWRTKLMPIAEMSGASFGALRNGR